MKKLLLITSLLSVGGAFGMTEEKQDDVFRLFASTNTYKGEPITSENILGLSEAPEEVRIFIQGWLEQHPDTAAIMSGQEAFEGENPVPTREPKERVGYYRATQERLRKEGLQNLSRSSNTVVMVGDTVIKASSELNREKNIATGLFGLPYGSGVSSEQFKEFKEKHGGKTYQTVSRIAYALRAREACEKFNLNRLTVPEKYLVHIPGTSTDLADTNYVAVAKKTENIVADLQEHALSLDSEVIRQLTILIGYTALWNHVGSAGNIFVIEDPKTKEQKLCYHDTEQPNVHSPADFFHKKAAVHFSNVHHGWNELKTQIIESYATHLATSIDQTNLSDDKKALLKSLVNKRVEELLKEKQELEAKISAYFPKDI